MKKNKFSTAVMAFAIGAAGMLGTAQVAQSVTAPVTQSQSQEIKGTAVAKPARKTSFRAQIGGLDIIEVNGGYGMSPMEYGMRYGNGSSRNGKHNRLRYSHNAKLKRRSN